VFVAMPGTGVLVVGETPSLGQAIADLLESDGVPVRYSPAGAAAFGPGVELPAVIVAACNAGQCGTARRWLAGEFDRSRLVVVGARDPALARASEIRFVPLPLEPAPFLRLVRSLLSDAPSPP
jgi:hypothetical protein